MRYSLFNRLSGSLLGIAIIQEYVKSRSESGGYNSWHLVIRGSESLVASHGFNRDDWVDLFKPGSRISPIELAIASISLGFFFHDNRSKLMVILSELGQVWLRSVETITEFLVIGYITAQSFIGILNYEVLINNLLDIIEDNNLDLSRQLLALDNILKSSASLYQTIEILDIKSSSFPIGFAIYCFLSNPDDFNLAIGRVLWLKKLELEDDAIIKSIAMMVGALSGGYHGVSYIPARWRSCVTIKKYVDQVDGLSRRLISIWSGAINGVIDDDVVVAAPNIIKYQT